MRIKMLLALFFVFTLLSMALSVGTVADVQAENVLQSVPRLEGKNIYFTEAGEEASRFDRFDSGLSRFAGLLRELGANLFTLEWRTGFPEDADLIVIAGPVRDLAPDQIARLWSYVNNNGRLLLIADPVVPPVRALPPDSGLFALMWADMGIRARGDVVATTTGTVIAADVLDVEATPDVDATPVPPSFELIVEFTTTALDENHPITAGISGELAFFTARSLEVDASIQGFDVTPLVFSSSDNAFYGEVDYNEFLENGVAQFNIGSDIANGSLPVAASFENDATGTRIVLIGDREFASNGAGLKTSPPNSASFVYPGNARFLLNAVTWLLETEPAELTFPTPGPTATPTITPSPTPMPTPESEEGSADSESGS